MDVVVRALCLYLILLVLMRLSGRRTLSELTGFDLILLLVVAEVTDNALMGQYSFTYAILIIVTLFLTDILLSLWTRRNPVANRWLEGTPVVVVDRGKWLRERMNSLRLSEDEVMQAAREHHGLERLDQVKFAVVEASGKISIIPRR